MTQPVTHPTNLGHAADPALMQALTETLAETLAEAYATPHGAPNPAYDEARPDGPDNPSLLPRPMADRVTDIPAETYRDTDGHLSVRFPTIAQIAATLAPTVARLVDQALLDAAADIEAELICCPDDTIADHHHICRWAIASRALVLGHRSPSATCR